MRDRQTLQSFGERVGVGRGGLDIMGVMGGYSGLDHTVPMVVWFMALPLGDTQ